ncbi:MAG: 50S ribosomal protein L32 [Candidatus Hydrogenedentota bacterium]|nr:MAG: 50S ribosomal protein L32 [Candidatus Hydrogenedentota bacterium]
MPVPKRKTGKTKRNMRRSHHAMSAPALAECQNCGDRVAPHHVCGKCGFYNTRVVLNVDDD